MRKTSRPVVILEALERKRKKQIMTGLENIFYPDW